MKYIKIILLSVIVFAGVAFTNINSVKAELFCEMTGSCSSTDNSGNKPSVSGCVKGGNVSSKSACSTCCLNVSSNAGNNCVNTCTNSFAETIKVDCKKNPALPGCSTYNNGVGENNSNNKPSTPPTNTPVLGDDLKNEASNSGIHKPLSGGYDCGGVLSDALLQEIIKIYRTVTLIMVVALVIFGMLDFFKAVTAGDSETMKKVTKTFTNRLLIVILLVTLPIVLNFFLTLFGDSAMNTCLDKINL